MSQLLDLIKKSLVSDELMQAREGKINRSFKTKIPTAYAEALNEKIKAEKPVIQTPDKKYYELFMARINEFNEDSYVQLIGSPVNIYSSTTPTDELDKLFDEYLKGSATKSTARPAEAGFGKLA